VIGALEKTFPDASGESAVAGLGGGGSNLGIGAHDLDTFVL